MPVDNLPKILECVLKGLLDEIELLSWSIQGGNMYTQLSIRFPEDDTNNATFVANCIQKSAYVKDVVGQKEISNLQVYYK